MPFVPKRLKDEKEYRDISTNPETVAGQTGAKRPEDIFEMSSGPDLNILV